MTTLPPPNATDSPESTRTPPSAAAVPRWRAVLGGLLLMAFSVLLTLAGIEVLLRVGFDALPPKTQADLQLVRRVPWSPEAIVPPVPFITDRRLQARLEPGLRDQPVRWHDARFTFDTGTVWDGHMIGLRTTGVRYPLDLLAFGDSFTFCWTDVADCWVQRLAGEYGYSATNAAIPGTGTTGQFHLMEEIAPPMQPRLIVWQWYGNDLFDDYVLAWLNEETPGLAGAPAPDPAAVPQGFAQVSALWRLADLALRPPVQTSPYRHTQRVRVQGRDLLLPTDEYAHAFGLDYPAVAYGWTRSLAALEQGHALAADIGAEMLLVLIPPKEEAYAPLLGDALAADYLADIGESRRRLLETCAARGWHCLDALPAFQQAITTDGATVYYALDFHLDASGNRLLAGLIDGYIRENGL